MNNIKSLEHFKAGGARRLHHAIGVLFLFLALLVNPGSSNAESKIVLQLAWKHQFQFAGYYAALYKGYYRQAGLDVTLVEGGRANLLERRF